MQQSYKSFITLEPVTRARRTPTPRSGADARRARDAGRSRGVTSALVAEGVRMNRIIYLVGLVVVVMVVLAFFGLR